MSDAVLPIRVYWEDTDAGGVVYHASYVRFMERGRTELLRAKGVDQASMLERDGVAFVVSSMNIRFRSPARLDDELIVSTQLKKLGGASLVLFQQVLRGADVMAEAEVICALISRAGKPLRLPDALKALLSG